MFDACSETCALELGVCRSTLEKLIRKKFDQTFDEYKKPQLQKTVLRLKQKMISKGLAGDNVCLIFTLKNISDWSDKVEHKTTEEKQNILVTIVKDNGGN